MARTDMPQCTDKPITEQRDPFAQPGQPGNRWLRYGCDGPIPEKYHQKLQRAVHLLYELNSKPRFVKLFQETVSVVTGRPVSPSVFVDSLDRMVLNLADTSTNPVVQQFREENAQAEMQGTGYRRSRAYVMPYGSDVWVLEVLFEKGSDKTIAAALSHEAAPIAGIPSDVFHEGLLSPRIDLVLSEYGYSRHKLP
jgi:hypothetical protein